MEYVWPATMPVMVLYSVWNVQVLMVNGAVVVGAATVPKAVALVHWPKLHECVRQHAAKAIPIDQPFGRSLLEVLCGRRIIAQVPVVHCMTQRQCAGRGWHLPRFVGSISG